MSAKPGKKRNDAANQELERPKPRLDTAYLFPFPFFVTSCMWVEISMTAAFTPWKFSSATNQTVFTSSQHITRKRYPLKETVLSLQRFPLGTSLLLAPF